MNANELADELTKMFRGEEYDRLIHEIPDMLRQQQAEIEAYKNLVKAQDEKIVDLAFEKVYAERSAEVVAELYTHPVSQYKAITNTKIEPTVVSYTHPVKELDRELLDKTIIDQQNEIKDLRKNLDVALMIINKPELTDEEIEDECRKAWGLHDQDQLNLEEVFKFARAILRKAREK